jgi:hypothetical protein
MSQHSMRRGTDRQAQALLQVAQALLDVVGLPLLLDERMARVVVGHGEQVDAMAALRQKQRDPVPGPVGEPLGDAGEGLRLAAAG